MKIAIPILLTLLLFACAKPTVEESLKNAREFAAAGDFHAAVVEYKNVLMQQPRNADLRIELANTHLQLGSFSEAEKEFEKAIERGADQNSVVGPLAKSIYYQDDYFRLLSRLDINNDETIKLDEQSALFVYLASIKSALDEKDSVPLPADLLGPEYLLIAQAFESLASGNPEATVNLSEKYQQPNAETFEKHLILASAYTMLGENQKAVDEYKAAKAIYEGYIPIRFLLAERLIDVGNIEDAEVQIQSLIDLNPASGYANYLLGITLLSKELYEEALQAANLAIQNGANVPQANFIAGVSAYRTERLESAYRNLNAAAAFLPNGHIAHQLLAQVRYELGYIDELAASLDTINVDEQISAEIYALAALRNYKTNNTDNVDEYLEKAINLAPDNPISLLRKGLIQLERGEDEATDTLGRAVALDNTMYEAWVLRARAELEQNGIDEAVAVAREWQQTNPTEGMLLEGLMYLSSGEEAKAEQVFKQSYQSDPQNINAKRFLMTANARLGNQAEAFKIARELITDQPNDVFLALDTANLAIASGLDPMTLIDEQIRQFPRAAAPVAAKAYLLIRDKQPELAVDLIKRSNTPAHHSTYMAMGEALIDLKQYDEAIANFKNWTDAFPSDSRAWSRLIILNQYLKNDNAALDAARRAYDQFPGNDDFLLLQAHLLVNLGDTQRASSIMRLLEQKNSDLAGFRHVQGMLAYNQGNYKTAQIHLEENYRLSPTFKSSRLLALAEGKLGRPAKGIEIMKGELAKIEQPYVERHLTAEYAADYNLMDEVFDQYKIILESNPQDFATLNNYANALMRTGEIADAAEIAEQALGIQPQSAYALGTMGAIKLKQGETQLARNYIEQALLRLPNSAELQLHYAEVLLASNEKLQAQTILGSITPKTSYERATYKKIEERLK